jgi:predicted  nucleic acid-binding Zn-ribbon protein
MKLTEADRGQLIELAKLEMELRKVGNHFKNLSETDPAEIANKEFLEVSERLSSSRAEQEDMELENKRVNEDLDLEHVEKLHTQELTSTKAELAGLEKTREQFLSTLPESVSEEYQRKAKRGVPVGILESGACSACHLNLNATDLASIRATAIDDLTNCPECQAILIR